MGVFYWRIESNVVDLRVFKDNDEFTEWLLRQVKLEPTAILEIVNDKNVTISDLEGKFDHYCGKYVK